jgi:ParB-like chromosome segregation protein Spo0J
MSSNTLLSTIKQVPIDELVPHPENARRGNVDAIAESLQRNGQFRPVLVQRSTNYVLAGNHTVMAAKQLGWEKVSVSFVDVDDEAARRILLADNRTSDLSGYDEAALADLLQSIPGLDGTGFDTEDLDRLLSRLAPPAPASTSDGGTVDDMPSAWAGHFQLVFDTDAQRDRWNSLIRQLRGRFPDVATTGERVFLFLGEAMAHLELEVE